MTLTLRLLQPQYSICENEKYVIDSDKLEFIVLCKTFFEKKVLHSKKLSI